MADVVSRTLTSTSPDETSALAQALAQRIDPPACLLLEGDIGAGKSHFARSFLRASGVTESHIPSPTFTLVQTYQVEDREIWHCDLYRLTSVDEVDELGLFAAFDTSLCLVEWPDRLGDEQPQTALRLSLAQGATDTEREIQLTGAAAIWAQVVQDL